MADLDWRQTSQLNTLQILAAFFVPSAGGYLLFHFLLPALVARGAPVLVAYSAVASAGLLLIVLLAVYFLRKEARALGVTFAARACLRLVAGRQWLLFIGLLLAVMLVSSGALQVSVWMIDQFNIRIPSYMPFFLNPTIDPMTSSMDILSPGLPLQGAYFILPILAITITLNILAEELYFRAWLLPKMSRLGNGAWLLNGALFALYHTFQLWLLPAILVGSLTFAYIVYRSRSIYPALLFHFVMNLVFSIVGIGIMVFR